IQGTKEQRNVERSIPLWQRPCVTDLGRNLRMGRSRLIDMQGNGIDEIYGITAAGEPRRIYSGTAADIDDLQRRRRQISTDDFFGALQFQRSRRETSKEALQFLALLVVRKYFRVHFRHFALTPFSHAIDGGCEVGVDVTPSSSGDVLYTLMN